MAVTIISAIGLIMDLTVLTWRSEDIKFSLLQVALFILVMIPFLPYLLRFRTSLGSVLVGVALASSVLGSIVWIRFFATDPLEGLWLLFLPWATALVGSALEVRVFGPWEQRRRRTSVP